MSESTAAFTEKYGCPLGSLGPSADPLWKGYFPDFSGREHELREGKGLGRPKDQWKDFLKTELLAVVQMWNDDAIFYLKNSEFGLSLNTATCTVFFLNLIFIALGTWMSQCCHSCTHSWSRQTLGPKAFMDEIWNNFFVFMVDVSNLSPLAIFFSQGKLIWYWFGGTEHTNEWTR